MQNGSVTNGYIIHIEDHSTANGTVNGGIPGASGSNGGTSHHQKYPSDKRRTFIALLCLMFSWILNDVALAWIHERVPNDAPPLPDLWFSIFPEWTPAIKATEALIIVSIVLALCVLFLHEHRWIVLRRVLLIAAVVYLGRALCITVTQVPVPSRKTYCGPKANKTSFGLVVKRVYWVLSGLGMDLYHERVLCGDLIYSGHTVTLVLTALSINQYLPRGPRKFRLLGYVAWLFALVGMVCILMARKHYTIDIILAYYITTRVFWIYHALVEKNYSLRRNGGTAALTGVFWYPLFNYFECDISAPIPNSFKF